MKNYKKNRGLETAEQAAQRQFKERIAASNQRIATALSTLSAHDRGQAALRDFKRMAKGVAKGLDMQGMDALKVLFQEWQDGRRDFVDKIPSPPLKPICRHCGETSCDPDTCGAEPEEI